MPAFAVLTGTGCRPIVRPAVLLWLVLLAACSELPVEDDGAVTRSAHDARTMPAHDDTVAAALYEQLEDWHSVSYRYGGLSKDGVDCSGFVHVTYLSRFGIRLPRSTEHQARAGTEVPASALQPGDLVFFRTGTGKQRHVGIYVERGRFIHASTSQGVTISDLDTEYWASTYWKAVRVEP